MDKIIRKVTDLAEQRAETYRYWRSRPSFERFAATCQPGVDLYRQKGIVSNGDRVEWRSCRMEKDQRDLLLVFNERKVRYLVVGRYAVSHYTEPRVTKNIDIFIDTSDENVALVYAALAALRSMKGAEAPALNANQHRRHGAAPTGSL